MSSRGRYVIDIMTTNPVVVGPATAAWSADEFAQSHDVHHLLVIDRYRLIGVVCGCDLGRVDATTTVGACMRTHPATIDDQETAEAAAALMGARGVGCLPVVDWSDTLRGVVTRHDLRDAGLLSSGEIRVCGSCGSTHGLESHGRGDAAVVHFCLRCREQSRAPRSAADEPYFTLGGAG